MYRQKPQTIEELKDAIIDAIDGINHEPLMRVTNNFENRLHAVVDKEGAHIEQCLH